ncbi:hypothetical protein K504DRAFT_249489 [Pleomassaria siparia CBS 279.74]|uniref:Uncharacterized protein n=1 Tax=Pleomassaria siparia CBS 279.74 TaxID=1314801 RepID=A0A6G1KB07_9PLEO|nr:hypothetical protein K504DRAFT_249489 [Pleomassaria siparia CBS 279.74]
MTVRLDTTVAWQERDMMVTERPGNNMHVDRKELAHHASTGSVLGINRPFVMGDTILETPILLSNSRARASGGQAMRRFSSCVAAHESSVAVGVVNTSRRLDKATARYIPGSFSTVLCMFPACSRSVPPALQKTVHTTSALTCCSFSCSRLEQQFGLTS